MFKRNLVLVVLSLTIQIYSYAHFSHVCTEVLIKFSHVVETTDKNVGKRKAKELAELQVEFMYGSMANDDVKGVPRGEHTIQVDDIVRSPDGKTRVHYTFEGPGLLEKGPRKWNTFDLPKDPTENGAYLAATDKKGFVTASDPHYQSYGDFWYFFAPRQKGSILKEGVDFDVVEASIDRLNNTHRTYPEYAKLVDKKTGTIPVNVFFGMDNEDHSHNGLTSKDVGAMGYRGMKRGLKKMGFKQVAVEPSELLQITEHRRTSPYTLERLEKETPEGKMVITLFYGPTGIDESSRAFHYWYKHALEKSKLMIYDGHSGLGAHLDIASIEETEGFRIKHNPKKYQICYFNSCSSYSYYNIAYQFLKGPKYKTKSLDILANGLATEFDDTQSSNLTFIRAIHDWAQTGKEASYQQLSEKMERANLFSINGDQDNPKKPSK